MHVETTRRRLAAATCTLVAFAALLLPRVARGGTVAYWRFESGAFLTDSAGSNTLTNIGVTGSADVSPFAPGSGSASLDGSQTTFNTASALNLTPFQDLTIECFFKTNQQPLAVLFEQAPADTNAPGAMGSAINDLSNDLEIYQRGTTGTYLEETLGVLDNAWHHMAMTVDGSESGNNRLALYVDGALVGLDNPINNPTGTPAALNKVFYIGSRLNAQLKYAGLLDELRKFLIVPEPATLPLAAAAGMLARRRRHAVSQASVKSLRP
jgi:hypothetical protein